MKRTAISRRTPLAAMSRKRQQQTKRTAWNSTIAARSATYTRMGKDYRAWANSKRKGVGKCELRSDVCNGRPESIHHVIKLSQGGARMPGTLAVRQGQIFMVSCIPCNGYVEDHPAEARGRGWVKSNPLKGEKRYA